MWSAYFAPKTHQKPTSCPSPLSCSFGFNAGYAINPARDFSPRLFTLIAGWGTETFSYHDTYWFYVPILGPFIGGAVGAATYTFLVNIGYS